MSRRTAEFASAIVVIGLLAGVAGAATTLNVGAAILAETGLSFFGFGVQPPDISLGTLIQEGTPAALTYSWIFLFPAVLLIVAVLAVNVMGDGLRDALDPQSSAVKARTRVK